MTTVTFLNPVRDGLRQVEDLLLAQADGYHHDLQAALAHLVSAGGKRVRPALALLSGNLLHAPQMPLLIFAAAVEMLHTATLVHDDLVDGALLRRGIPTLNARWSPAATVLTGDFLFARSAHLAARTNSVRILRMFAETLSIIASGEVAQLFSRQALVHRDDYFQRIYAKTASLFELATAGAAVLADAPEETIQAFATLGRNLGLAFQIVDDILDFAGDQARLGKPVGSDLRNGIVTLPVLCYMDLHPDDPAVQVLRNEQRVPEDGLDAFIERIRHSEALRQAAREAHRLVDEALTLLQPYPPSPEREAIEALGHYIVDRDF